MFLVIFSQCFSRAYLKVLRTTGEGPEIPHVHRAPGVATAAGPWTTLLSHKVRIHLYICVGVNMPRINSWAVPQDDEPG